MRASSHHGEVMSQEAFRRFALEAWHRDLSHYELLNGRVVAHPPETHPHGSIIPKVYRLLLDLAGEPPAGVFLGSSQGFEWPTGDSVQPDATFVCNERWRQTPPVMGEFLEVVPDLVIEVLSEETAAY